EAIQRQGRQQERRARSQPPDESRFVSAAVAYFGGDRPRRVSPSPRGSTREPPASPPRGRRRTAISARYRSASLASSRRLSSCMPRRSRLSTACTLVLVMAAISSTGRSRYQWRTTTKRLSSPMDRRARRSSMLPSTASADVSRDGNSAGAPLSTDHHLDL